MTLINSLQIKTWLTNNWAITNLSSLNSNLDLFFLAGASRQINKNKIEWLFEKAFYENKITALKILFWARNIRWWAWERKFFRVILELLINKINIEELFPYVVKYWRWDDLFFSEKITRASINFLKSEIEKKENWLLFKWLPREKSSNWKIAQIIRKELWLSHKEYRKLLVENSSTVENEISLNKWEEIDFSKVPSKAFLKLKKAFEKHTPQKFKDFIEKALKWETKIHAWAIFPSDIYADYEKNPNWYEAINAQWKNLPDYMEWNERELILPVCDVSWSMYWQPMQVSISLGVYLSERNNGPFKDAFITFSENPKIQILKWTTTERFKQLEKAEWGWSTNILWVFKLILWVALRDWLSQSEMPKKIIIISDMEFDSCARWTNYESIRDEYNKSWYELPSIIFWNVNWRPWNIPVSIKDKNVALVSWFSPSIMTSLLWWEDVSPLWIMNKTLQPYSFVENLKL